ncbi:hypothetical protein RGUI_0819 [Rhodovulum sp. P5]|uniref:regulatory protein GemA n=1 Tax=Rhodovulum phage vB_RhkS_P1 TaxID=1873452 RepID=UPI00080ABA5B|nr:regulatory protein GemA [Rhodovulum sp. P5]YP_009285904.1 regulatory protein GemA [Rhodovulum phage vB_RhkS_P1]ANT39889.1 protein of unknown function DUF1018 [Rhodovulum phage vB_RhkS_P1]ARE38960.1 hypothetical protein RGUI_0819 [Rhodovulum sp. P5]
MTNPALTKLIHVGARELGLDADTRHDLQLQATGKASLSDMTEAEQHKVLEVLRGLGFVPRPGKAARPMAPRSDLRLVHVLWSKLSRAGKTRVKGRKGLNAFIRARFEDAWGSVPLDVDALRDAQKINAVIRALKDWCAREGIVLDGEARPR